MVGRSASSFHTRTGAKPIVGRGRKETSTGTTHGHPSRAAHFITSIDGVHAPLQGYSGAEDTGSHRRIFRNARAVTGR